MTDLADVLKEWDGTPYVNNQCVRGQGVDCVRFVCAVLDEKYGTPGRALKVPVLPSQTALHNREAAFSVLRSVLRLYPIQVIYSRLQFDSKPIFQPWDLVVASYGGNPGHVGIVGPDTRTVWHAWNNHGADSGGKVCFTGIGAFLNGNLILAGRPLSQDECGDFFTD